MDNWIYTYLTLRKNVVDSMVMMQMNDDGRLLKDYLSDNIGVL